MTHFSASSEARGLVFPFVAAGDSILNIC